MFQIIAGRHTAMYGGYSSIARRLSDDYESEDEKEDIFSSNARGLSNGQGGGREMFSDEEEDGDAGTPHEYRLGPRVPVHTRVRSTTTTTTGTGLPSTTDANHARLHTGSRLGLSSSHASL